jgi:hypothetical protein
MGNTFEIHVWAARPREHGYEYFEYWRGESLLQMMIQMVKAKRAGHGCVTLHWR